MGRRALRKISPELDLSVHLRDVEQTPVRWTSRAWFGNDLPLELEVGSGKGLFISRIAAAQPEANYVGVELRRKYARFAAAKLARGQCVNAVMVHGDALSALRQRVPSDVLQALHIYFPDPWWKKRHKKRRVFDAQSVVEFERVLRPGGALHFWTDVEEYDLTARGLIAQYTQLQTRQVLAAAAANDLDYRTHFERRTRLAGRAVFRGEFRKP